MGGTLSSPPLGSRPHHHVASSTSVCNHLFAPPDGAALYMPSRQPHWPSWQIQHQRKTGAQHSSRSHTSVDLRSREQRPTKLDHSNGGSAHSRAPFVSPPASRELPYTSLALNVDSNSNYAGYNPRGGTVIPNVYSIAREDDMGHNNKHSSNCKQNGYAPSAVPRHRYDFANNNLVSPPISSATTPVSPVHQPISSRIGTRIMDVVEKEQRSARSERLPSPSDSLAPSVHAPLEVRRRTVMHASTSDLLRGLGRFVAKKAKIDNIDSAHVVMWMRAVDRSLLLQGWQDIAFINPANLVFVFLLMRNIDDDDKCLQTTEGIHQWVLTCLYVAYSYMGNEISYPLKPFLIQKDKTEFWSKCVALALDSSADMLRLNSSSSFFTQIFAELKRCGAE